MENSSARIIRQIQLEEYNSNNKRRELINELWSLDDPEDPAQTLRIIEILDELDILYPQPISANSKIKKHRPHFRRRTITIVAATISLLLALQFISLAAGGNFFENIYNWGKRTFISLLGQETSIEGIDFSITNMRTYLSVNEFEEAEGIVLAIPQNIPNFPKVSEINYSYSNVTKVADIYYTENIRVYVDFLATGISNTDGSTIYTKNDISIYVFPKAQSAYWYKNGALYHLSGSFTSDEYEEIVSNIK